MENTTPPTAAGALMATGVVLSFEIISANILEIRYLFFHYIFRYESFLFLAFLPLLCPLHFLSISVVQEFLPAVHQIRLSASP